MIEQARQSFTISNTKLRRARSLYIYLRKREFDRKRSVFGRMVFVTETAFAMREAGMYSPAYSLVRIRCSGCVGLAGQDGVRGFYPFQNWLDRKGFPNTWYDKRWKAITCKLRLRA